MRRRRILFASEAAPENGGAFSNAQRKVKLLQDIGSDVRVFQLARSRETGSVISNEGSVGDLLWADVLYARLNFRSLLLAVSFLALPGRFVVFEANGRLLEKNRNGLISRVANTLMSALSRSRRVLTCGDRGHQEYYSSRWPQLTWEDLPLGVDDGDLMPLPDVGGNRMRAPGKPSDPLCGFVFAGSLTEFQGISELLAAYSEFRLSWKGECPSLSFIGAGPYVDEVVRSEIPGVFYLPPVARSHLPQVLAEALCLVSAAPVGGPYPKSSYLKVLSYMASGKPCIVPLADSFVCEVQSTAGDGVFIWDGSSILELAECFRRVAAGGDELRSQYFDRSAMLRITRGTEAQKVRLEQILERASARV